VNADEAPGVRHELGMLADSGRSLAGIFERSVANRGDVSPPMAAISGRREGTAPRALNSPSGGTGLRSIGYHDFMRGHAEDLA